MGKQQDNKKNAAKVVSSAILGVDFRVVVVAGGRYVINPPSIKRLAGAAHCLAEVADAQNMADILASQDNIGRMAAALSWFITGDDKLKGRLADGTLKELVDALQVAYNMLDVGDFTRLSALAKNVGRLTAKPKP